MKEEDIKVGQTYRILWTRIFVKVFNVGFLGRYAEGITKSGKMFAVLYEDLAEE